MLEFQHRKVLKTNVSGQFDLIHCISLVPLWPNERVHKNRRVSETKQKTRSKSGNCVRLYLKKLNNTRTGHYPCCLLLGQLYRETFGCLYRATSVFCYAYRHDCLLNQTDFSVTDTRQQIWFGRLNFVVHSKV